jgi:hypothetical protein
VKFQVKKSLGFQHCPYLLNMKLIFIIDVGKKYEMKKIPVLLILNYFLSQPTIKLGLLN